MSELETNFRMEDILKELIFEQGQTAFLKDFLDYTISKRKSLYIHTWQNNAQTNSHLIIYYH